MTIRIPVAALWTIGIALALTIAAIAGATGYRLGPYASLQADLLETQQRLKNTAEIVAQRDKQLDTARKEVATMAEQLTVSVLYGLGRMHTGLNSNPEAQF